MSLQVFVQITVNRIVENEINVFGIGEGSMQLHDIRRVELREKRSLVVYFVYFINLINMAT